MIIETDKFLSVENIHSYEDYEGCKSSIKSNGLSVFASFSDFSIFLTT